MRGDRLSQSLYEGERLKGPGSGSGIGDRGSEIGDSWFMVRRGRPSGRPFLFVNRQQHWNTVYTTKGERDVSWFEASPDVSIEMIEAAGLTRDTCVLDVGGGDSRLVDLLVARGLTCVAVLDVA